jgi:hypothetical protein
VRETDLTDAQPDFNIDTCAPQIGAVGQSRRLAAEPHGMILVPQIETLPTGGKSRGLACTTNQGGVAVAGNLAGMTSAAARFHLFLLNLDRLDAGFLCDQLHGRLEALFQFYGIAPSEGPEAGSRRKEVLVDQQGDSGILREEQHKPRTIKRLRFVLRQVLARPLYKAAKLKIPMVSAGMIKASKELLPSRRPLGELAPYAGEAITELREGIYVLLNVGPTGCMVSSMGEVFTPRVMQAAGTTSGRIQTLFSADGDVNEELLTLVILKIMGPDRYNTTEQTVKTAERHTVVTPLQTVNPGCRNSGLYRNRALPWARQSPPATRAVSSQQSRYWR